MTQDLKFHLKALTRFIYYVTEEEDRFINQLLELLTAKYEKRTWIYNSAFGLVPARQLIDDWKSRAHKESDNVNNGIVGALTEIYRHEPQQEQNYYIITDPDRWLQDQNVVRRVINIAHQLHSDENCVKVIIFVGPRLHIPQKLARYIEVIQDKGLTDEDRESLSAEICAKIEGVTPPKDAGKIFRGLTSFEVDAAISQSVIATKKDANPTRVDPGVIMDFKRRQLKKTDLLTYVDTASDNFNQVGGAQKFKDWALKTKASWTDEGQAFGLKPPKGVLAVGVWGCGKSLSVKAMANAWRLPMVELELGRLRQSGVGDSENNTYRALSLIESVAPCVVRIDEGEKSLSGGQSSAQTDAGTTARMIGIISTWLQDTMAPICLAITANNVKTLPIEFINRMDERFFFDLPSEEERIDILKIHLLKKGQDPTKFDLAELADASKHMVGREIEQAIGAAMIDSFDADKDSLDGAIFLAQLKSKPRIFKTMAADLKELLEWVGYDKEHDEGIRARFASNVRSESFKFIRGSE